MTIEFDRRSMLQAGAIAGAVAASAAPAAAQHAPAKLSTHALDMYLGKQAAGMRIDFSKKEGDAWKLIKTVTADENGRVGEQLMSASDDRGRPLRAPVLRRGILQEGRREALQSRLSRYRAGAHRDLRRHAILPRAALLLAVEHPELSRFIRTGTDMTNETMDRRDVLAAGGRRGGRLRDRKRCRRASAVRPYDGAHSRPLLRHAGEWRQGRAVHEERRRR